MLEQQHHYHHDPNSASHRPPRSPDGSQRHDTRTPPHSPFGRASASAVGASPSGSSTRPLQQANSHLDSQPPSVKMPQYTSRDVGDPSQIKKNKQSMADLKLRRLTELNNRLREDLERRRIPVSEASNNIIAYCNSTRDYMVPSVWGAVPKGEDPYAPPQNSGCCVLM
ncbi:GGL domain-containing protein [Cercophora scortea]|uniref:Guanine nucleotide-binding protein subunit gamma n=1 Tax=Cercophora scortea TaxID=314031 RepID=A0AAE0MK30_9PEZI|nr:GGL domain-containing protein [Cercophora scortea]